MSGVRRQLLRAAFALPLALLAVAVAPSAASSPASLLVGDAPVLEPQSTALGSLASSTPLDLTIVLRSRDPAGLAALASAVSTPGSPDYHDYLSVGQFAQRFGAAPAAVAAVTSTLRADGLTTGALASDGLSLSVSGDAATVSQALSVDLERYRERGGTEVYANTAAARLPASLAGDVNDVLGLSDVPVAAPVGLAQGNAEPSADAANGLALDPQSGQPAPCLTAQALARPGGPYTINQIADAYGLGPLYGAGDVGAGVTVALYELEPYSTSDINTFQACFGTSVSPIIVTPDGSVGSGSGSGEAALDIENVIGLAPGATIKVYEGPNGGTGPYDTLSAIVNDPSRAQVVSDSWGLCEPTVQTEAPSLADESEYSLFEQAAVQGQSVLAASGDDGADGCDTGSLAVDDPASQPYVTGVGGTTLSATGTPPTESVWNTIPSEGAHGGASGGGISTIWAMPAYQSASNVAGVVNQYSSDTPCAKSTYCREVPDVSADADPQTGYVIYYDGQWGVYAGTSAAAPFWAGMTALADASGAGSCAPSTPLGFLNPNLYAIAAGPGSADAFNDITSGDNGPSGSGDYPATTGYDLATGLGSPIATDGASAGLIDQLCDAPAGADRPPAVSGLSAHDTAPGSTLTIDGSGFTSGATVAFGTVSASNVSVVDSGHINVTVPAGSGTVDVTVATTAGTSAASSADQFTFGPAAAISIPANAGVYTEGQHVLANYSCSASTSAAPTCTGTTANGLAVDTAAVGSYQFTVTATDSNGVSVSQTAAYTVVAAPKISIGAPLNGATVFKGEHVAASYSCATSAPLTITSCRGSVASGKRLQTAALGQFYLTVEAVDSNGVAVERTASYDVVARRATVSSLVERARIWLERPLAGSHLPVGTSFSFWTDQSATVSVHFMRIVRGRHEGRRCVAGRAASGAAACTTTRAAGMVAVHERAGHHSIAFAGKASAGTLAAGPYTATVVAVGDGGRASAVATVRFTIAPSHKP